MKLMCPLILLFSSALYGDSVAPGALVWSGSPMVTCCAPSFISIPAQVNATDTGIVSEKTDERPNTYYGVAEDFTVTAAGGFVLASDVNYSGTFDLFTTCDTVDCSGMPPSYDFMTDFSGSASILDSAGTTVFSVDFAGAASQNTPCELNLGFSSCGADATLELGDDQSGVVDLATGNYTLAVQYHDMNNTLNLAGLNSSGYSIFTSDTITTNLTPTLIATPEPHELWLLISGIAALLVGRASRRKWLFIDSTHEAFESTMDRVTKP